MDTVNEFKLIKGKLVTYAQQTNHRLAWRMETGIISQKQDTIEGFV